MELYQLRTFVTVAAEANLTRAARRLHTSPPAVSAQIRALEAELNLALFVRSNKGMYLTAAGEHLRTTAEAALSAVQAIVDEAATLQGQLTGAMTLGINGTPAFLRVPAFMSRVRQQHPNLKLTVQNGVTGQLLYQIRTEQVDAGYIFGPSLYDEVAIEPLCEVDLVVAAPTAWSQLLQNATWCDLATLPWIESSIYCPFQEIVQKRLVRTGMSPANIVATDDGATKLELVRAGLGLALIEKHAAEDAASTGMVIWWEPEPIRCMLSFAYLAKRRYDPYVNALRMIVASIWS